MPFDDNTSLGGPEDTLLPALDGDSESEVQEDTSTEGEVTEETPSGEDAQDEQDEQEGQADETVADEDPLLAQFAKRTGLDPADPSQRKTLDTLVAKEKYIQELKAKLGAQETGKAAEGAPRLTKFEQEQLAKQQQAETNNKPPEAQVPQPPPVGQYNDAGVQWRGPEDAYRAMNQAWEHAAETGDFSKVQAVEGAIYERRFDAIGMPKVEQFLNARLHQFMEQNFGQIMPVLQEQIAAQRTAESSEAAFADLEGTEGYSDIRSLDQDLEGPPLVVNGQQYRNTPLNRILVENPWISAIKRDHADPQVADRLTYLARLKAAHKIHSSGRIDAQKAKALVDAGSQQEKRSNQDRVRQSLNSGGTPSRSLDQGKSKPKGYIEDLIGTTDGPVSFSEL